MAANYQTDNSGKFIIFDKMLWWVSVRSTHPVAPAFDHNKREVNLGCQEATFDAIQMLYWKLLKERIKHALRMA